LPGAISYELTLTNQDSLESETQTLTNADGDGKVRYYVTGGGGNYIVEVKAVGDGTATETSEAKTLSLSVSPKEREPSDEEKAAAEKAARMEAFGEWQTSMKAALSGVFKKNWEDIAPVINEIYAIDIEENMATVVFSLIRPSLGASTSVTFAKFALSNSPSDEMSFQDKLDCVKESTTWENLQRDKVSSNAIGDPNVHLFEGLVESNKLPDGDLKDALKTAKDSEQELNILADFVTGVLMDGTRALFDMFGLIEVNEELYHFLYRIETREMGEDSKVYADLFANPSKVTKIDNLGGETQYNSEFLKDFLKVNKEFNEYEHVSNQTTGLSATSE
jgi:hypothetical protein